MLYEHYLDLITQVDELIGRIDEHPDDQTRVYLTELLQRLDLLHREGLVRLAAILRGDDGFGVEVIRRLHAMCPPCADVELMDVGTGGIRLAQELLTPYDRLIIVDAMTRGGEPGSIYVLVADSMESVAEIDLHSAVPSRALALAKALSALPREVFMVGCEPAEVDELTTDLSPPVRAAVDTAVRHIH